MKLLILSVLLGMLLSAQLDQAEASHHHRIDPYEELYNRLYYSLYRDLTYSLTRDRPSGPEAEQPGIGVPKPPSNGPEAEQPGIVIPQPPPSGPDHPRPPQVIIPS